MKPQHLALGVLVAAIWGFNFIPIKLGLESFPPFLLVALRFVVAGLPAFFLPKPALSWPRILGIAVPMFLGQYLLLFTAMKVGMPPGLASITMQVQVVFTMIIAALLLKERPSARQIIGSGISIIGLCFIAATIGVDVTIPGLLFTIAAAACWGNGNVMLRQVKEKNIFALIVWLSASVAVPALALSLVVDGPATVVHALATASLKSWAGLLFIACVSTLTGFWLWGYLLRHYTASTVSPLALLVPVFGGVSSYLCFGEHFAPMRLAGMAFIMAGLVVTMLRAASSLNRQS